MSSHERAGNEAFNNVTYQRCQFAYEYALSTIEGKSVIDIGCGNAYGTAFMASKCTEIKGLDYSLETVNQNIEQYKDITNLSFKQCTIPPINLPDASVDVVTAFQFIEHIKPRKEFLKEVYRILKPGGVLLLTTPNVKTSLARNPFHVHEYTFAEMDREVKSIFDSFELRGLQGNEHVNTYYQENGKWVRRILKWDILGLHKILPASLLTKPYDLITNLMRKKLMDQVDNTLKITTKDFFLIETNLDSAWDIYLTAKKVGN